jgi:probable rRNA maturation factor
VSPRARAKGAVHVRSEHPGGASCGRLLAARARKHLRALGRDGAELSILLVGDKAIRRLNRTWRGKDVATDVLSFPAAGPGPLLGDVVISLDTARRVAAGEGRALADELERYLAHGILHLLGHDHEKPAQARRMAQAEDALVGEGMVSASFDPAPAAPRSGRAAPRTSRSRSTSPSR